MSGTSGATRGLRRTTWNDPSLQVRLIGFTLAVGAVSLLIVGIDTQIWRAQGDLQSGFTAIRAEKFYFGVNFRMNIRKLNATLLDFQLTGNPTDLQKFRNESSELKDWLRAREPSFGGSDEQRAFKQLESAYEAFLATVEPLLQRRGTQPRADAFATTYAETRQASQPLLAACDAVVKAEHSAFDQFLGGSDRALLSLQHQFLLSLLLLIALAVALALLVYRGMLAPLRAQLTESQALVARQEKLAALGALGAGVAHEIRNPLTAIKFRLFSLKKVLPPHLAESEDALTISDEINRLDRIVKDFLQFARPSEPELVRVPAERILQEVHDFMKAELEQARILLKLEISHPAWILADTHQLKQVLINLVQNSADSMEQAGTVKLSLLRGTASLGKEVQSAAILSVTDNGSGIPAAVQKRLFDPFFTTKEGGTGLGLAIAARIVEKHSGLLRYRTEINRGTTFEIVLPVSDDATKNIAH